MSYNFRGLTTSKERVKAHFFLKGLPKSIDILCGQEHKVRSNNTRWLKGIWPEVDFVIAHDGMHANRNGQVPTCKGGVFMAIGPRLKQYVTAFGITRFGRAMWSHMDHPKLGWVGFVVVYVLNNHKLRAALW